MSTLQTLRAMLHKDFDLPLEKLEPAATLEDLEIDSLRMIEILFSVEETFKVTVSADQAELKARLKTFGDLVDYIDSLVGAKPA